MHMEAPQRVTILPPPPSRALALWAALVAFWYDACASVRTLLRTVRARWSRPAALRDAEHGESAITAHVATSATAGRPVRFLEDAAAGRPTTRIGNDRPTAVEGRGGQ
jgi:hypothetical protein